VTADLVGCHGVALGMGRPTLFANRCCVSRAAPISRREGTISYPMTVFSEW
jgi:hypothetical protein